MKQRIMKGYVNKQSPDSQYSSTGIISLSRLILPSPLEGEG